MQTIAGQQELPTLTFSDQRAAHSPPIPSSLGPGGGMASERNGIVTDMARGAVAGVAAWWAMDQTLRILYDHEHPSARRAEDRARAGVPALEVVAERAAALAGVTLSDERRQAAGTAMQWVVGIGAGMLYGVLRSRFPAVRAGRGLAYGAAFSLGFDEGAVPLLGFAPGPAAFPWQTHARGFVGHLVFGAVAEATLTVLGSKASPLVPRSHVRPGTSASYCEPPRPCG
ncbi:MAG: DUF1440 domain-containing protein [Gemmatimonadales bacterium]|nr:DUF1440 domain-containing protein [Gemmatimonadales bacterium]MDQ3426846.1 DUF1440 domain-containing protein [Gemmatimonadota bacterium]